MMNILLQKKAISQEVIQLVLSEYELKPEVVNKMLDFLKPGNFTIIPILTEL